MRRTGPDQRTRSTVLERDNWLCRRCGRPGGHIHHRLPRQAGGTKDPAINLPSNLVLLCAGCHERVESHRTDAYLAGWLVHRFEDPETVPVLDECGVAWCLTEDGMAIPVYRKAAV